MMMTSFTFGDFWTVAKDDGPTQSDVHVDKIIGAIHPFAAGVGGKCVECGKTSHVKSFAKMISDPFDFSGGPDKGEGVDGPSPEDDDSQDAWPKPPSPMLKPVTDLEVEDQENQSPEFMPVAPAANSSAPMFGGGALSSTSSAPSTVPFHQPLPELISKRFPRGSESGQVGEWVTASPQGVYNSAGQLDGQQARNGVSPPVLRQDGPVFGTPNPGQSPPAQSSHQASPAVPGPAPEDLLHHFNQCPQCGVGVDGTEKLCPNPQCGHNLENDPTASYDHWAITGGTSK